MKNTDFVEFAELWSTIAEVQGGREPTAGAIEGVFKLLSVYELEEVVEASMIHCRQSPWTPRAIHIINAIEGVLPDEATQYGLAIDADTILGAFLYSKIGSFDLKRMNEFEGINKIKAKTEAVNDFVKRAQVGDYTDNEIRILIGRDIDPCAELCHGLPGVRLPFRESLKERASQLSVKKITSEETESSDFAPATTADKAAAKEAMSNISKMFKAG